MDKPRTHKNSPLRYSEFLTVEDYGFWKKSEMKDYIPDGSDILYTVMEGDNITLLANNAYGDPRLSWVISWANDLYLPEIEFYPGLVIRIPTRKRLLSYILKG